MKPVELVSQVPLGSLGGIGRYVTGLYCHLHDRAPLKVTRFSYLPGTDRMSLFKNFPLGLQDQRWYYRWMGCIGVLGKK